MGSSLVGSNFNAQVTCPSLTTQDIASHLKYLAWAADLLLKLWQRRLLHQAGPVTVYDMHMTGSARMNIREVAL